MGISQILFVLVSLITLYFATKLYGRIIRNIRLGESEQIGGNEGKRWKNLLLVAFGQRKMFKKWIPAVLHLFIYVAFVITQIEFLEMIIDGLLGTHRIFAPFLGGVYTALISFIEILSILALVATFAFLTRRIVFPMLKRAIPRFEKPEMIGWPKLDAILILIGELTLIFAIFLMNSSDLALQNIDPDSYHRTGDFLISSQIAPYFMDLNKNFLVFMERSGWWLHLLVVYGFILYLAISKHLHIFLAFPNVWYAKLNPRGEMENMPTIMNEVKSMMEIPIPEEEMIEIDEADLAFGANDIFKLSWKNIMDAYSCTECGRCTEQCPANHTGKKLSPRKIMMDIRDRADEVGKKLDTKKTQYIREDAEQKDVLNAKNFDDGKNLFDYISKEEIHACTTCNACVEACPILINPLDAILKLRRYEILTESAGPAEWTPMFTSLENSGGVWSMPEARDAWTASVND